MAGIFGYDVSDGGAVGNDNPFQVKTPVQRPPYVKSLSGQGGNGTPGYSQPDSMTRPQADPGQDQGGGGLPFGAWARPGSILGHMAEVQGRQQALTQLQGYMKDNPNATPAQVMQWYFGTKAGKNSFVMGHDQDIIRMITAMTKPTAPASWQHGILYGPYQEGGPAPQAITRAPSEREQEMYAERQMMDSQDPLIREAARSILLPEGAQKNIAFNNMVERGQMKPWVAEGLRTDTLKIVPIQSIGPNGQPVTQGYHIYDAFSGRMYDSFDQIPAPQGWQQGLFQPQSPLQPQSPQPQGQEQPVDQGAYNPGAGQPQSKAYLQPIPEQPQAQAPTPPAEADLPKGYVSLDEKGNVNVSGEDSAAKFQDVGSIGRGVLGVANLISQGESRAAAPTLARHVAAVRALQETIDNLTEKSRGTALNRPLQELSNAISSGGEEDVLQSVIQVYEAAKVAQQEFAQMQEYAKQGLATKDQIEEFSKNAGYANQFLMQLGDIKPIVERANAYTMWHAQKGPMPEGARTFGGTIKGIVAGAEKMLQLGKAGFTGENLSGDTVEQARKRAEEGKPPPEEAKPSDNPNIPKVKPDTPPQKFIDALKAADPRADPIEIWGYTKNWQKYYGTRK